VVIRQEEIYSKLSLKVMNESDIVAMFTDFTLFTEYCKPEIMNEVESTFDGNSLTIFNESFGQALVQEEMTSTIGRWIEQYNLFVMRRFEGPHNDGFFNVAINLFMGGISLLFAGSYAIFAIVKNSTILLMNLGSVFMPLLTKFCDMLMWLGAFIAAYFVVKNIAKAFKQASISRAKDKVENVISNSDYFSRGDKTMKATTGEYNTRLQMLQSQLDALQISARHSNMGAN
jgi:hypothetical protein